MPEEHVSNKLELLNKTADNPLGLPESIFTYKKDPNWRRYDSELWAMSKDYLERIEKDINYKDRLRNIREDVAAIKRQIGPLGDVNSLKMALGIRPD